MTTPLIRLDAVSRAYGQVVALNDVSLEVQPGVVGLLGPNGAGKTTMLRMLSGEIRPTLGTVQVFGMDPFANPDLHRRIGICPEDDVLFDDLRAEEFLRFLLRLRGFDAGEAQRRSRAWLDRVGLADVLGRRLRGFSKGMRQRVKLACAFAHQPDLLILDEPLTGLDPLWRHHVQKLVRQAVDAGAAALFSSHVLHEVEQATRNVVLLFRGRVAAQGHSREIRALIDTHPHRVHVDAESARSLGTMMLGWNCVQSVRIRDDGIDLTTPQPDVFYTRFTEAAAESDLGVTAISSPDDSLQSLFETLLR